MSWMKGSQWRALSRQDAISLWTRVLWQPWGWKEDGVCCVQEMCPISHGCSLLPTLLSTFLGLILLDKRTWLFHCSSASILWTKFQRDMVDAVWRAIVPLCWLILVTNLVSGCAWVEPDHTNSAQQWEQPQCGALKGLLKWLQKIRDPSRRVVFLLAVDFSMPISVGSFLNSKVSSATGALCSSCPCACCGLP